MQSPIDDVSSFYGVEYSIDMSTWFADDDRDWRDSIVDRLV